VEGMMLDEEKDSEITTKMIDVLAKKVLNMDDICWEILFTLMAKKELRTNQLYRSVIRFSSEISKKAFHDHLKHLVAQGFIERKEEDPQNVTYGLTKESQLAIDPPENVSKMMQIIEDHEFLKPIDVKEEYRKLTEKDLDQHVDNDIRGILSLYLHELEAYVQYELKTSETMTNRDFWKFVGNPMYRMFERSILEDCRYSDRYKLKLFERIEGLMSETRLDKALLKEREERRKKDLRNNSSKSR
jgi:DNA-binding HxlR family transcriptional regulator